ncbi:MAG: hypothetical protein J6R46_01600, partial [Clostridia bacterium]|nr:hypothetical protein [Clostridia bacterium]
AFVRSLDFPPLQVLSLYYTIEQQPLSRQAHIFVVILLTPFPDTGGQSPVSLTFIHNLYLDKGL